MGDNQKLKSRVKELCADERFIHHKWFFAHHLELVERLAHELKTFYPDAREEVVESLIWFHDLEKILRNQNISQRDVLSECGFVTEEIEELERLNGIEEKHREIDLSGEEIEVKILASADGAAHLIGPFFPIFWYENPNKSIEELMSGNLEKVKRDWERKMVLPEIKKFFANRRSLVLEQNGVYPSNFLL